MAFLLWALSEDLKIPVSGTKLKKDFQSHIQGNDLTPPFHAYPDSKVHEANMGPTWVLSAPGEPHVGLMNLAICVYIYLVIIVPADVVAPSDAGPSVGAVLIIAMLYMIFRDLSKTMYKNYIFCTETKFCKYWNCICFCAVILHLL